MYCIVSIKHSRQGDTPHQYITLWRHNDAGCTWNLNEAGKYDFSKIQEHLNYYHNGESTVAVLRDRLESMVTVAMPGTLDSWKTALVIENTYGNWEKIRNPFFSYGLEQPENFENPVRKAYNERN